MRQAVNDSIFKTKTLDRKIFKWEDSLYDLTPVQEVGDMLFKRDDWYAPLGYGGINGAKLRQLVWLTSEAARKGKRGIVTGSSVLSPQLPMAAACARHFESPTTVVLGATKPTTAVEHDMVKMAAWFGAEFDFIKVAYNPSLQKRCASLAKDEYKHRFYLEYGITLDHHIHKGEDVEAFHSIGAEQVKNIPDDVKTLIIPAGSCNSCTSILYGLSKYPRKNLKDIHLIGIGPTKIGLVSDRLRIFKKLTGVDTKIFRPNFVSNEFMFRDSIFEDSKYRYNLHYDDLHAREIVQYSDWVPYEYGGIDFHPTYEGKVMTHVFKEYKHLVKPDTLFWIIGSKPSVEPMMRYTKGMLAPELPKEVTVATI